jgi:putative ABC transport system substrate-binding protein
MRCVKPGEMVARQPPAVELVINLKTAKVLDLMIPPAILDRADEVFE